MRHFVERARICVLLNLVEDGTRLLESCKLLTENEDIIVSLDLVAHLHVKLVEVLNTLWQTFFIFSIIARALFQSTEDFLY